MGLLSTLFELLCILTSRITQRKPLQAYHFYEQLNFFQPQSWSLNYIIKKLQQM